jgi:hypothetical protein
MSSLKEIEKAIGELSSKDRAQLVKDLPSLLPEWEGDLAWQKIIRDPSPSPSLSKFVDEIDEQFRRNPEVFPKIITNDFEQSS